MKKSDPAVTISNPRLFAAAYYGLLSVAATILINAFLVYLGIEEIVPLYQSIIIGMVVASATGALFGEKIVHCPAPYKARTFWLGFSMVMVSLPFFDLGILLCLKESNNSLLPIGTLSSLINSYFVMVIYSYFLFGFLLATAAGLASMYLRGRMVYDMLHIYGKSEYITKAEPDKKAHNKVNKL